MFQDYSEHLWEPAKRIACGALPIADQRSTTSSPRPREGPPNFQVAPHFTPTEAARRDLPTAPLNGPTSYTDLATPSSPKNWIVDIRWRSAGSNDASVRQSIAHSVVSAANSLTAASRSPLKKTLALDMRGEYHEPIAHRRAWRGARSPAANSAAAKRTPGSRFVS